ncbi:hypothetical protein AYI68_g570 [Smittium mucronatum]|uniref:DUF3020 domain-containing protein n=1 Tax=Smittium mucronatum TaxID=133383 RepID=A0A1R0H7T7_9FUNG|nr:hypothetical protein AYI68_g570 [Smittium mucronatum]
MTENLQTDCTMTEEPSSVKSSKPSLDSTSNAKAKSKLAVRERMRIWRSKNKDKNKLNDIRCRVYKAARDRFGKLGVDNNHEWVKKEIEKRIRNYRSRAQDRTQSNRNTATNAILGGYSKYRPKGRPTRAMVEKPLNSKASETFAFQKNRNNPNDIIYPESSNIIAEDPFGAYNYRINETKNGFNTHFFPENNFNELGKKVIGGNIQKNSNPSFTNFGYNGNSIQNTTFPIDSNTNLTNVTFNTIHGRNNNLMDVDSEDYNIRPSNLRGNFGNSSGYGGFNNSDPYTYSGRNESQYTNINFYGDQSNRKINQTHNPNPYGTYGHQKNKNYNTPLNHNQYYNGVSYNSIEDRDPRFTFQSPMNGNDFRRPVIDQNPTINNQPRIPGLFETFGTQNCEYNTRLQSLKRRQSDPNFNQEDFRNLRNVTPFRHSSILNGLDFQYKAEKNKSSSLNNDKVPFRNFEGFLLADAKNNNKNNTRTSYQGIPKPFNNTENNFYFGNSNIQPNTSTLNIQNQNLNSGMEYISTFGNINNSSVIQNQYENVPNLWNANGYQKAKFEPVAFEQNNFYSQKSRPESNGYSAEDEYEESEDEDGEENEEEDYDDNDEEVCYSEED